MNIKDGFAEHYSSIPAPGTLTPGMVDKTHFHLLIDISSIYSEKIIYALELHLVNGLKRNEACLISGISQSCLSIKLRQLQRISRSVVQMYPWYCATRHAKKLT